MNASQEPIAKMKADDKAEDDELSAIRKALEEGEQRRGAPQQNEGNEGAFVLSPDMREEPALAPKPAPQRPAPQQRPAPPQQRQPQQRPVQQRPMPQQRSIPPQQRQPQQRPAPMPPQQRPVQQRPMPQQGSIPPQQRQPQQRPAPMPPQQRPVQQRPAPQQQISSQPQWQQQPPQGMRPPQRSPLREEQESVPAGSHSQVRQDSQSWPSRNPTLPVPLDSETVSDTKRALSILRDRVEEKFHKDYEERKVPISRDEPLTVEDIVRQEVRVFLKKWLDAHLPSIVQSTVRKEVERVVQRQN